MAREPNEPKTALRSIFEASLSTDRAVFSFGGGGGGGLDSESKEQPNRPSVATRPLAEVFAAARRALDEFNGPELVGAKFCRSDKFTQEDWEESRQRVVNDAKRLKRQAERSGLGNRKQVKRDVARIMNTTLMTE